MAIFGYPRLLALTLVALLVGGCDLLDITTEDYELPFLRTGEQSYELATHEHYKKTTISLTFRNGTGDEVYIGRCRDQPNPPALEKRVDGEWKVAYQPISLQCLSSPVEIDEGDTYEYEFEIEAWTRPNTEPRLEVDQVEGTYRVNWETLVSSVDDHGVPQDPLPTEQRLSNTFTLRER